MSHAVLPLRDYQTECITAIKSTWHAGQTRVAVVLPTGAGKTFVFCHSAEDYLVANPGRRVMVLAHTDELCEQAFKSMHKIAPHRSIGIVKADVNQVNAEVIIASVQTLRGEKRRNMITRVGLIIVDECHHATATTYRAILEHFGAMDEKPAVLVAGFTATLIRADTAKLSEIWGTRVAYKKDIAFMIRRGYLLKVKGKRIVVPDMRLEDVKRSGGDYQVSDLADELVENFAPEIVAKAYAEHAMDRQGIVFTPDVASAYTFCEAFNEQGIKSEVVHGALPKQERRDIITRLVNGDIQCVVNCMVLTEGFDAPCVSCVVMARPTKSASLYQQAVGRGMRPNLDLPADQRGDCLILDVVGVGANLGLSSLVDLSLPDDPYERDTIEDELQEIIEEGSEFNEPQDKDTYYVGSVDVRDFDPLVRASKNAWGRTADGTWFVAAGKNGYVFLVQSAEPGMFDIAWCSANRVSYGFFDCPQDSYFKTGSRCTCVGSPHTGKLGGWTEHKELDLESALSWGEEIMEELDPELGTKFARKTQSWRYSKVITPQQEGMANGLGIVTRDEDGTLLHNKGVLSDLISMAKATQRIDPVVGALLRMRERESVS